MLNDIDSVADEALGWYTAMPFAVGGLGGFLGGYFDSSLSLWLTGVLVTTTGSYLIPFVLGAVVAVIAGIVYLLLLRAPILVGRAATEIGDTSS